MPPAAGRDQQAPMERMVRLIGLLTRADQGVPVRHLLDVVVPGTEAELESRRRALGRVVEQLNLLGYDVRNVADEGADGVYVMHARDNRLQVHLTAEQRGELLRAAIAAGLDELAPHLTGAEGPPARSTESGAAPGGSALDLVQRATAARCRLRFEYKGEARTVHPLRVHSGPSGWYLSGREDGQAVVKEFVVSRMADVELDAPGTAEPVTEIARPSLDPLSWQVDPPTEVTVACPVEQRVLAENLLGAPVAASVDDGTAQLRFLVTNRAIFRLRVYELGTRVRVLGPDDVRRELLAELEGYLARAT